MHAVSFVLLFVILVYTLQVTSSINIVSVFSHINMSKPASTNSIIADDNVVSILEESIKKLVSQNII